MDGCQIQWAQHWAAASLYLSVYSIPELVGNSGAAKCLNDVHSAGDGLWVAVLRESLLFRNTANLPRSWEFAYQVFLSLLQLRTFLSTSLHVCL